MREMIEKLMRVTGCSEYLAIELLWRNFTDEEKFSLNFEMLLDLCDEYHEAWELAKKKAKTLEELMCLYRKARGIENEISIEILMIISEKLNTFEHYQWVLEELNSMYEDSEKERHKIWKLLREEAERIVGKR